MKNLHGCGCDCSVQPCLQVDFERLKVLKNAENLFMQLFFTITVKQYFFHNIFKTKMLIRISASYV